MLRLLLDDHIPPAVAEAVKRLCIERNYAQASIVALRDWRNGAFLGLGDHEILTAAYKLGLTLVTYDLRTIPPLLKGWAESGISHGGVIYVDQRTIHPSEIGRLARALAVILARYSGRDWTNQSLFLEK
jgi:hypothetical protein